MEIAHKNIQKSKYFDYSKMTKAELVEENIELRRQRDMYYWLYTELVKEKERFH